MEAWSRGRCRPRPRRGKGQERNDADGERITPPRRERIRRVRTSSEPRGSRPSGRGWIAAWRTGWDEKPSPLPAREPLKALEPKGVTSMK